MLAATLQELGDFYLSKGQRAVPPPELISSLRGKLKVHQGAARLQLPVCSRAPHPAVRCRQQSRPSQPKREFLQETALVSRSHCLLSVQCLV